MRTVKIGAALLAALGATAVFADTSTAQQQPADQPALNQDQPDQAAPPPPKTSKHARAQIYSPAVQANPDLDTDDQLAPSQMRQPVPAAAAAPASAQPAQKPAVKRPVVSAATDATVPVMPAVAKPAVPVAAAHVVTCSGTFAKDSTHLKLAMTFDTKNITFTDVEATGGAKVPASVLFPSDPKRRLEVWWSNPATRSDTYLIVINGKSTWVAPGGMRLGLTLAQLEKLNHKAFKLKGFDKDGVATVSDWDGGELATLAGGCKSGLSLRADAKASPDAVAALSADHEYSSSDPAVRAVKPAVSEILIGY
jgi:hypothetical protein